MKPALAIISLAIANFCCADTLRISELATGPGENIERMILKGEDNEEVLFVRSKIVIADMDVEYAQADYATRNRINVSLNKAGGKKLQETTAKMAYGRDRLAIIIDGRLHSAPYVQSTLASSFTITGFQNMGLPELDALARKVSGLPSQPEGDNFEPPKPVPRIETTPFTEEEYLVIKSMREKMGVFHLESAPSKDDLNHLLSKGMSREEVFKLFGKPTMASNKPHDDDFYFIYTVAPEKLPENLERAVRPDGFKVDFKKGKTTWWSLTSSNSSRREKVVGQLEATLRAILPEVDFSANDLDLVAYIEGIVVPDPLQEVNKRDLWDLTSMAMMLSEIDDSQSKKSTLNANCDFMKTLSNNFPDVELLRKGANEGRIQIEELNDTLSPYVHGEKELPTLTK